MGSRTDFGRLVNQRRKALDLTQSELARRVGCSPVMIHKIETGQRRPSKQLADLLAEHLAVAASESPAFLQGAVRVARHAPLPRPPLATLASAPRALLAKTANPTHGLIGRERPCLPCVGSCSVTTSDWSGAGTPGIGKTRLALQLPPSWQGSERRTPAILRRCAVHPVQLPREAGSLEPVIARLPGVRQLIDSCRGSPC
jgi:transcriptional regulator with XRE-family HTH domain